MITYREDASNHFDLKIKEALRAYNQKHTGPGDYKENYLYLLDDDQLQGGLYIDYFWNWTSIRKVYYKSLDDLKKLIETAWAISHQYSEGIKLFTPVKSLYKDFLLAGFKDGGIIRMTRNLTYYHAILTSLEPVKHSNIAFGLKPIERYQSILDQHQNEFDLRHEIKGPKAHFNMVALDDDCFVGGIQCDAYDETFYVNRIIVIDTYKEKGIGKTLMGYAEKAAIKHGLKVIELGTCEFQAKGFYQKLGYQVVHTRKNHPKGFESYTMVKKI
jgi:ribosomal protein S18 acetylase RimI-like enzyme